MLIEFTFGNFRSFRDEATLSLIAAENLAASEELTRSNVFTAQSGLDLVKIAAIYGANASGKSNLIAALRVFKKAVLESATPDFTYPELPFVLDTVSAKKPGMFEMVFLSQGHQFRYGFEINHSERNDGFVSEWLFRTPSGSEAEHMLFRREGDVVHTQDFPEVDLVLENHRFTQKNSLVLSVARTIPKNRNVNDIVREIESNARIISGLKDDLLRKYTQDCLETNRYSEQIEKLISVADSNIEAIRLAEEIQAVSDRSAANLIFPISLENSGQQEVKEQLHRDLRFVSLYRVFDEDGVATRNHFALPLQLLGSEGTKKLFAFAGPVFDCLEHGYTLFVDEIDARFHPILTRAIVELFQHRETNPKNAQLIFVTHDTNLLDARLLRRDQIWFVEKDRLGVSHLYSLADIETRPGETSYEEDYFMGRYGAIPFLGGLRRLLAERLPAKDTPTTEPDSKPARDPAHAGT